MADFHFLRPYAWLLLLPLLVLIIFLLRKQPAMQSWKLVCDSHLLDALIKTSKTPTAYIKNWIAPLLSFLFIIFALSGPTWSRLPVPAWQPTQIRVILLDVSEAMLEKDIPPNRLTRAKFIIRDVLNNPGKGQFGMIAYSDEPFIVSPLTDDGLTITSLLPSLHPDMMPVGGQNLALALTQAQQLIQQAGYSEGELLILTANTPTKEAIEQAKVLSSEGFYSSIIPLRFETDLNPLFKTFIKAGQGQLLPYTVSMQGLQQWLASAKSRQMFNKSDDTLPIWKDQGLWFIIPALFCFLPVFRRGWLERVSV